jgi:RNA polymerase sigma-70 factor (ECF subfamily)
MYGQTAGPLRAYVVRTLGGIAHADDIVQETYLRALRRPLETADLREWRAYLFRIAGNLLTDHWRTRGREASVDDAAEPSVRDRDATLRLDLGRIFARLRPRDRQLLWLAYVERANHGEIAAAAGVRVQSVKVLLSRARNRLARLLRDTGQYGVGVR